MTKVVFQDISYWLRDEFWQQPFASGVGCYSVGIDASGQVLSPITSDEFALQFSGRVAGWVRGEPKSASILRDALPSELRDVMDVLYVQAVAESLQSVCAMFTARTGAQGKKRLPALATFVVVFHTKTVNGDPHFHVHIAVKPRVDVLVGPPKTYATHTRELYQLRKLFDTFISHNFAHLLQTQLGVRVEKTANSYYLPDVPKSLCHRTSVRTQQINKYIRKHKLKNTPIVRKYAAFVTRKENPKPEVGQKLFQAELARSGFLATAILREGVNFPLSYFIPQVLRKSELRAIRRAAAYLARTEVVVTRQRLLMKVMEQASPRRGPKEIAGIVDRLLESPEKIGLQRQQKPVGKAVYVSRKTAQQWKKITQQVEFTFDQKPPKSETPPKPQPQKTQASNTVKLGETQHSAAKRQSATQKTAQGRESHRQTETKNQVNELAAEPSRELVLKVLRSYRVIGAVGRAGLKAVEIVIQLYQSFSKPIWQVHGAGHKNMPGSVAKMVRDLKPLTIAQSHKAAVGAMLKLNGTLEEKIRCGEYVYRQSRKAKFRIPRKSLIVIRDVGQAKPKDVSVLLKKAKLAKAKVLFVDREYSRFALMQAAQTMKPGQHRHTRSPEMQR